MFMLRQILPTFGGCALTNPGARSRAVGWLVPPCHATCGEFRTIYGESRTILVPSP
jgi:hypothetical protein